MYLGMNISHDASAAIVNTEGMVLSAISEERISRVKNHVGLPIDSIMLMLDKYKDIEKIVIGTFDDLSLGDAQRLIANLRNNPSNPKGTWNDPFPGFKNSSEKNFVSSNPKVMIENVFKEIFADYAIDFPEVIWVNHHEAHLGCALGISDIRPTLLFSLDGEGDGESGAIAISNNKQFEVLKRISKFDSLGHLYSAVTRRYNFKAGKHEGKITGLAAYGEYSSACETLLQYVSVVDGLPKIHLVKNLADRLIQKNRRFFGLSRSALNSLEEIVSMAELETKNYADLAFAIQDILEKSVLEIIDFWTKRHQIFDLSFAGGVFANVKLNQKISEMKDVNSVRIFPNMGDGGLSIGGIWRFLSYTNKLTNSKMLGELYLAPENSDQDLAILNMIMKNPMYLVQENSIDNLARSCANDIENGLVVALHQGAMEFGPRALGNRSMLADPRNVDIVKVLNERLRRTEFMPFAPVVLAEDADLYFELPNDLQPFEYMTMTCNVRKQFHNVLPAITHIDGTARPQLVGLESNNLIRKILLNFKAISGLPILVNTSLNIHEEPINYLLNDSIYALEKNAFDILYYKNYRISMRNIKNV